MSKLSTVNIPSTGEGGNVPKTLKPGNHTCTIHAVTLKDFPYKPGGLEVILNLEGPDQGSGFEGFWIEKGDESKGRFKGQVGSVKATEWAFADGTTKSGIPISRDTEILKFMRDLCKALNAEKWLADQDGKHDTIQSLINAFNQEKPFAGKVMEYCLCGKEYFKGQYPNYELFLPKFVKGGAPFNTDKSKVITYNPDEHIRKKKVEQVQEFGSESTTELGGPAAADFNLD
jgi:hypothetical protein